MTLTAFEAKTIGGSLCGISALHIDKDGSRHHFHSPIDVGAQPKKDPLTLIGRIEGAPALRDIWPEIRSWFTGSLVLFCGSDLNALVKALEAEGLYVPTLFYINLKEMARGARPDLFPDAKSIS
ncbi:MAG: hypothetical protein IJD13_09845, partial [Oscillospiraceae bacterium]|nr:hypothetical protein [Oscillospiraceae bacterium]